MGFKSLPSQSSVTLSAPKVHGGLSVITQICLIATWMHILGNSTLTVTARSSRFLFAALTPATLAGKGAAAFSEQPTITKICEAIHPHPKRDLQAAHTSSTIIHI